MEDFQSVESKERKQRKKAKEIDKDLKKSNLVVDQWFEKWPGRRSGDIKLLLFTRMKNGQKYKELYCNAKTKADGTKVNYDQIAILEKRAKEGGIPFRNVEYMRQAGL